jgi:hypothetical protein
LQFGGVIEIFQESIGVVENKWELMTLTIWLFCCKKWPNNPWKTLYVDAKALEEFGYAEEDLFEVL